MSASSRRRVYRFFGEEFEPGFAKRLIEIRDRLDALRRDWDGSSEPDDRARVLELALDELDEALERTREARRKVARVERRLAARYETLLARLREVERNRSASPASSRTR